ncbi:unnamed protein product [Gemmata massiliana]|uniref:Uncharacterized protein n=1 Tax=Gemmata massiliana TaxID=1210884 RepID=A0A6P2CSN6_9BACT|nr:hypothetical protein [Gemmata massiliana]VTR91923.1 unnamed protein product [Gemmata massiliana]
MTEAEQATDHDKLHGGTALTSLVFYAKHVVWFVVAFGAAYTATFLAFWFGSGVAAEVREQLPSPLPELQIPKLPQIIRALVLLIGPGIFAGIVAVACPRWWKSLIAGPGFGVLGGTLFYLSPAERLQAPIIIPVAWTMAGLIGSAIVIVRRAFTVSAAC